METPNANTPIHVLRLGARGSMLSRMQSQMVADTLAARHPGLQVPLTVVKTSGDRISEGTLHAFGGKGLFTKELEQQLLAGEIDFAVHSLKDVPVTMPLVDPDQLQLAAIPAREDPRDVLVSEKARNLLELPQGVKVGTGSLRRQSQILDLRPDLQVSLLRGNVDTRIKKLKSGEYDAVILAYAGLRRSGLFNDAFMTPIPTTQMLPSAGQGALAIQCRRGDARVLALLSVLNDPTTALCVDLERAVVARLNGDCHSPIAAYAVVSGEQVTLSVAVGRRDGQPPVLKDTATVPVKDATFAVDAVVRSLVAQGVRRLLGA